MDAPLCASRFPLEPHSLLFKEFLKHPQMEEEVKGVLGFERVLRHFWKKIVFRLICCSYISLRDYGNLCLKNWSFNASVFACYFYVNRVFVAYSASRLAVVTALLEHWRRNLTGESSRRSPLTVLDGSGMRHREEKTGNQHVLRRRKWGTSWSRQTSLAPIESLGGHPASEVSFTLCILFVKQCTHNESSLMSFTAFAKSRIPI